MTKEEKEEQMNSEVILDIEQTDRKLGRRDDRDLNNRELAKHIQESPLRHMLPEDEISIISSRIETNRKGMHNSTYDILNSTHKNRLKDDSSRILESIKKNKTSKAIPKHKPKPEFICENPILEREDEIEGRNVTSQNFKRFSKNNSKSKNWRASLSYLKKSQSMNKLSIAGEHKDSIDAILKTHRQKAQKELMPTTNSKAKKRPGSAGNNQNKSNPLDVAKMNAHLKLLRKSITKSETSSKNKSENDEMFYQTSRGPILPTKQSPNIESIGLFKRNVHKQISKRRDNHMPFDYSRENQSSSNVLIQSPKTMRSKVKESPEASRISRIDIENISRVSKRNQLTNQSNVHNSKLHVQDSMISEIDESMLDKSLFRTLASGKYKEIYLEKFNEFDTIAQDLEKEAEKEKEMFRKMLQEHKISDASFDRKLKGVEKWKRAGKREIKNKKKNFIQILGFLQRDKFDLQNFKRTMFDTDESKLNLRNTSNVLGDLSMESSMINKNDRSEYNIDKHVTPFRDINSSSICKGPDYMGLSNLSVVNSALKNHQKAAKAHKGHESNLSIDSSRCVKAIADKDKHLYSIVPFEYKVKSVSVPKSTFKKDESKSLADKISSEIVIKTDSIKDPEEYRPSLVLKNKRRTDSIIDCIPVPQVVESLNISNNSIDRSLGDNSIDKVAKAEIVFEIAKVENIVSTEKVSEDPTKRISEPIKDPSYESPQKCETEDDWNFKLPSIKSSSGHEHFRHSHSEHADKENDNSMSLEMLEKSPEVTVFISEKELSPQNPFSSHKHSHKKSRLEYLRERTNEM